MGCSRHFLGTPGPTPGLRELQTFQISPYLQESATHFFPGSADQPWSWDFEPWVHFSGSPPGSGLPPALPKVWREQPLILSSVSGMGAKWIAFVNPPPSSVPQGTGQYTHFMVGEKTLSDVSS